MHRDEEYGSSDLASEMTRASDRVVSGRDLEQSFAKTADNAIPPALSSEETDEFATASSSPAETCSEEDQEVTFRLRSESHSQSYAFNMTGSR